MDTITGDPDIERVALSLKPALGGAWHWSLAGEGFSSTGAITASGREDAVIVTLAAAYDQLVARGPVQVVTTLPETARIWSVVEELATHFIGVTLARFTDADTDLRAQAMRALEPAGIPTERVPLGPMTVATDGSAAHGRIGWGWLAGDGRHACGTAEPTARECARRGLPLLAELRGISAAISALPERKLVIRTDCRPAIALLRDWIAGRDRIPSGYIASHHKATECGGLLWIKEQVRREAHRIEFQWVQGHAGNPLNEGADSLAKLARRAYEEFWPHGPEHVPARAEAIASAFTSRHPQFATAA